MNDVVFPLWTYPTTRPVCDGPAAIQPLGAKNASPSHRQTLKTAINGLDRLGNTNIANAITFGAQQLSNLPGASNSQHLVLVTDGQATRGDAEAAARAALGKGIDSVNTVALPDADVAVLQQIADVGHGQFVDGTDLTALLSGLRGILDDAETLVRLDIELPNGQLLEKITPTQSGDFAVDGLIRVGENLFRARATSSLGNVSVRDLIVIGVAVPEPTSIACAIMGTFGAICFRRALDNAA